MKNAPITPELIQFGIDAARQIERLRKDLPEFEGGPILFIEMTEECRKLLATKLRQT